MPMPSFPQSQEPQQQGTQASFEEVLERYQAITDISKKLILAEIEEHESEQPPSEWSEFIESAMDQPELITDVLSSVIDIAAQAIIELSQAEEQDSSHDEILDDLINGISEQDDDESEQEGEQ